MSRQQVVLEEVSALLDQARARLFELRNGAQEPEPSRPLLLNVREAAEYLGVSQSAIRKEIKAGRLEAIYSVGGGRIHLRRADLDRIYGPRREVAGP